MYSKFFSIRPMGSKGVMGAEGADGAIGADWAMGLRELWGL